MKYLGIDYGSKRIGIAISDKNLKFAFPKVVIENNGLSSVIEQLSKIISEEDEISGIVLGHSANLKGVDNPIMKDVRQLKDEIDRKLQVKTFLEPEFYTSIEASRLTGKNKGEIDAQAAAIILQSFLNKKIEE